ncbi:MAG: hypothetical protein MJY65_04825 [Bacteroidaceae bacterium]|nr:hypothetical protein [Bacteroidaceae bacterium]
MRKHIPGIILTAAVFVVTACGRGNYNAVDGSAGPLVIYPDYKEVTIPANIAPPNFHYAMKGARNAETTFTSGERTVKIRGTEVEWPLRKWKSFIAGTEGQTIVVNAKVNVGGQTVTDTWNVYVSKDPIDGYLTYRLIEPSYQMYNEISIEERCIEDFSKTTICDYRHTDNSCMNCHTHTQGRGDISFYYIRGEHGGTVLNRDGQLRKLTLNADVMLSGTVYGELHPGGRFGVFSTNVIIPGLHTMAVNRMEVYDSASDLSVADFDNNLMINLPHVAETGRLETFPCFSADGNSVFYCVADTTGIGRDVSLLKYSLLRADFDASNGHISEVADTVWNGAANNASACHPKASPDGKWLMFTVSDYGTFPLYHTECTLCLMDLQNGEVRMLDEIKGDKSDTYHSWSSNSRWFVFASKRGDGQYGKPYFCHIDETGSVSKPFVLPQKSAQFYGYNLKSFNIPDLGDSSTGLNLKNASAMFNAPSEPFSIQ